MVIESRIYLEAYVWKNEAFCTQPLSIEVTDDDEARFDLNGKEAFFVVLSRLKDAIKYAEEVYAAQ